MSVYSDYQYRGQPASQQQWAGGTTPSPARTPSKLTEEQLLLLQQQWSQRARKLRSDQRSACSARSSVSGVQYSRVTAGMRPVSSSCAGRVPASFIEAPAASTQLGELLEADDAVDFTAAGLLQPLLQPKLTVRRRTDADVGIGADEAEVISPVGRLRNRHTGPGHHHSQTYGGSPFTGAHLITTTPSGSSSNYSTFAPYTPSNNTNNNPVNGQSSLRLGRTLSLPGRRSTPNSSSSTASLAALKQYAFSNNASSGYSALLHGQDSSSSSSSSTSRQVPSTPYSWAVPLPEHTGGLQPAFSAVSSGSAALQPAFFTGTSSTSASARSQGRAAASSGASPAAASQGALGSSYNSYSSNYSSTGSCTPVSSASSGAQTPVSTRSGHTATTAGPSKSHRRSSSTDLPPLAPAASGALSTYSIAAAAAAATTPTAVTARLSCSGTAAAAAGPSLAAVFSEEGRYAGRVSSTGSYTGRGSMQPRASRHSNAGSIYEESIYGDEGSCYYMASVPEAVASMHTYPSAGGPPGRIAASPMAAAAAAAAAAAIAEGYGQHQHQQQQQHASLTHSFLPPLETVLTGQSELSEDAAGSPRVNPGCMLGLLRALRIRKAPARKTRSPRKRRSHKKHKATESSGSSPRAGSRLGQVVSGWQHQQQQEVLMPREGYRALPSSYLMTSHMDSLPSVSSMAATNPAAAPTAQHAAASCQNGRAGVVYLQRPQQMQVQAQDQDEDLGYSIAAVGPDAVAAAGVCEPASTGTGAVSATTVLYNSSPRGIYRYSSPNAGSSSSSAYVAAGYAYSMPARPGSSSSSSRRMSTPAVTQADAAAPKQQTPVGMRGRLVSAPGVTAAAVTEAAAAAANRVHASRPQNRVALIAQNLEPLRQQQRPAGYSRGNSRSFRAPSTPGSVRSYTSSSGAFGGAGFFSTGGSAMVAAGTLTFSSRAAPVLVCSDFDHSTSSGTTAAAAAAAAADRNPENVIRPNTLRASTAGSTCGSSSGDSSTFFRPSSRQLPQQQQHVSTEARTRRISGTGSTVSTASERRFLQDRTYAEVASSPRLSFGSVSSRSAAGHRVASTHVTYRASGPRQLQPVSMKGQLSWQPQPRGSNAGYLSTQ